MTDETRLNEWCMENAAKWQLVQYSRMRHKMLRITERDELGGYFYDISSAGPWLTTRDNLERAARQARAIRAEVVRRKLLETE